VAPEKIKGGFATLATAAAHFQVAHDAVVYSYLLVGALALGWSMARASFPVFLLGLMLFGLGVGAGQQLCVAAADRYPPNRRAEEVGYVLMGALVGARGGPLLITLAAAWSPHLRLDPLALSWWLVPVVLLPSLGVVRLIRPDPKEIAANLLAGPLVALAGLEALAVASVGLLIVPFVLVLRLHEPSPGNYGRPAVHTLGKMEGAVSQHRPVR